MLRHDSPTHDTAMANDAASDRPESRQPLLPKPLRNVNLFLDTHIHEPLCADDLAQAAGTSVRSLYSHFRDFIGMTPMEYVKTKRLELAREALLNGYATNVSSVALLSGFNHMGRFSGEYKRRFGESPKQTLKFGALNQN